MKTIAIIGLGNRGSLYARHLKKHGAKIVALCEKNPELLKNVQKKCDVPEENCFTSDVEFFTKGRLADGIVIATQDRDHYGHCLSAIDLGYDILCEKPVSPIYEQCVEIDRKVKEKGVLMMVCHVLRYSKYFDKIKQIIDSGVIGDVVGVTQIENVGYWHFAHSYVRGNWRREDETGPSILAKCCHDLDMIYYLTQKNAISVASTGSRKVFLPENKPEDSPKYCLDGCPHAKTCPYHVSKIYLKPTRYTLPLMIVNKRLITQKGNASMKDFKEALKTSPYGRCVYDCDNDVIENQTVQLKLEDGVNATLTMTAFSNMSYRHTRISGTKGEILGNDISGKFKVNVFSGKRKKVKFGLSNLLSHLGGDIEMCKEFIELLETKKPSKRASLMSETMESHVNAFAAEESRKTGKTIDIAEFLEQQ